MIQHISNIRHNRNLIRISHILNLLEKMETPYKAATTTVTPRSRFVRFNALFTNSESCIEAARIRCAMDSKWIAN